MKIYSPNNVLVLEIEPDSTSYRVRSIMTVGSVVLYYSLPSYVELPVGSYFILNSVMYTLRQPEAFVMKHSRQYDYTVTFMAPDYGATVWMFINPIDHRLTFDLTATPREHLQMFVDNMNMRDQGWQIGECPDGAEKVITYDYTYCFDALKAMADTFHTEFEIINKRVSLKMVEYHKNDPITLCYGSGNGFKSGVGRGNEDSMPPVDRLMVQGSERNIDYNQYGTYIPNPEGPDQRDVLVHSSKLLLPRSVQYAFDGEKFEDEEGYNPAAARHYATDTYGYYVERTDSGRTTKTEQAYDATYIYPKRVGTVSSVVTSYNSEGKLEYDIVDTSIPNSLNYADCWIEGGKLTVIFQSGMLAGREFDVKDDGYHHSTRTFELVSQEYDGVIMPTEEGGFLPVVGDKYIVVGCMLPDAYIRDDSTRTGAEWDMLRAAIRYRFQREDYLYTFTGDTDEIWLHQQWATIGARFKLGEYVRFRDSRIGTDVRLRMTTIKDYLDKPWKIELTLSNAPMRVDFADKIRMLSARTSRSMRRLSRVSVPQDIQTLFRFVNSKTYLQPVVPEVQYVGEWHVIPSGNPHDTEREWREKIIVPGGLIQHNPKFANAVSAMSLVPSGDTSYNIYPVNGDYDTTADFPAQEIDTSNMDGASTLYLYAKIKLDHSEGTYVVVTSQHAYEDNGWLWLYMGEITPLEDEERTFIRKWKGKLLKDEKTASMSVNLNGVEEDVADVLDDYGDSIAQHGQSLDNQATSIATMTNKLNTVVERSNDLTTLLVTRLFAAITAFNDAQTAQGARGNTIDINTCIDDGTGLGTDGDTSHCKAFPDIAPINNV